MSVTKKTQQAERALTPTHVEIYMPVASRIGARSRNIGPLCAAEHVARFSSLSFVVFVLEIVCVCVLRALNGCRRRDSLLNGW